MSPSQPRKEECLRHLLCGTRVRSVGCMGADESRCLQMHRRMKHVLSVFGIVSY